MRIILGSYNLIEINLALIVDFMPDLIAVISYRLSVHLGQGIQERTKEICERQRLKMLKAYGLLKADQTHSNFSRLSSPNFTWSILEYFVSFNPLLRNDVKWSDTH